MIKTQLVSCKSVFFQSRIYVIMWLKLIIDDWLKGCTDALLLKSVVNYDMRIQIMLSHMQLQAFFFHIYGNYKSLFATWTTWVRVIVGWKWAWKKKRKAVEGGADTTFLLSDLFLSSTPESMQQLGPLPIYKHISASGWIWQTNKPKERQKMLQVDSTA